MFTITITKTAKAFRVDHLHVQLATPQDGDRPSGIRRTLVGADMEHGYGNGISIVIT